MRASVTYAFGAIVQTLMTELAFADGAQR